MEGAMHDSRRYRDNAAACLLAAQDCQPCYRKLHLSMTTSWLSLARHDEAIDNLLASWDMERTPGIGPIAARSQRSARVSRWVVAKALPVTIKPPFAD